MEKGISILLPTHNCRCTQLVAELQRQCLLTHVPFEIIVADDGSTDKQCIEENKAIETLPEVRYIVRERNVGRAAIRNFLASQARYDRLLFIDGDLKLDHSSFIDNYLRTPGDVVVGGIRIGGDPVKWKNNLRYRYEKACEKAHCAHNRQKNASRAFRTTNFLIRKQVFTDCPFDEKFTRYGYEDVLLGKDLQLKNTSIVHIDNPITLDDFESNDIFLNKTEESLCTLLHFKDRLKGYSSLLDFNEKLKRLHLIPFIGFLHSIFHNKLKQQLLGNNPSVMGFNIYKLMYFIHLEIRQYRHD